MKKDKNVVLAQPAAAAPPSPLSRASRPVHGGVSGRGEAYRVGLRYQSLLQDYQELVKETESKKKRLLMEKLKKQRLLAEVKLKNPAMTPALRTAAWAHDEEHCSAQAVGSSSKGTSSNKVPSVQQRMQHSAPRASPVINLNEACEPEPVRIDNAKYPLEGDVAPGPSDAKVQAFCYVQNSAGHAGKRKISRQYQLAM